LALRVQAGYLFLLIFLVGLGIFALQVVFTLLLGAALPNWPIAYYLAAPLVIGALYLLSEFLWQPVARVLVDADQRTDPVWKRGLRVAVLIFIGCAIAGLGVFLRKAGWP
jgi:hypothetical protein